MDAVIRGAAILLALLAAGCWPSLEEEAADRLGPEVGDPSPTHRPGQPCLVCHSERYDRGERVFVVAGTVYQAPGDPRGVEAAEVRMTGDDGTVWTVLTNQAGNFMVQVSDKVSQPEDRGDGRLRVPAPPVWPLRVSVRRGAITTEMRNVIHREGSCAACHTDPAGATSNGVVSVVAP